MAGVKHDPLADIALIAANLRDRYQTGFPILKEIVQNADDAGATHLSFGYSKGLPQAKHDLLKNPAVFFINNGPLTSIDADAILSIALGSKASNENAIGKFGLGMKSLFHLCEAFFYLSDQWAEGEAFHSNIFNPWGDLRDIWEDFNPSDKHLIQQHLDPVINGLIEKANIPTWFLVWVPLRKRHSDYDGSIIEYYPGDNGYAPDFILDGNIDVELGQLLPLLKGLNEVAIWQPSVGASDKFYRSSNFKLKAGAVRRQFHAPITEPKLAGKILFESEKGQTEIEFAGYENLLPDLMFQNIRSSEYWPKSYERDRQTGKEKKVEDKTKPHLAIVICQQKASERASCHIDWAVFLPLGTYTQSPPTNIVNPDDKYNTQVFIHGYFFVDAGRKYIYALDTIGKQLDSIESNDNVRSQWNSILATEGCLSYLPEAVNNFVVAHNCNVERIQHLSEAIFNSSFARQHRQWISQRYQWLFELRPDKKSWQLISAQTHALPLPNYPNHPKKEQGRAWSVLPKLIELGEKGYMFYDQSQVSLLNESHSGWSEELILNVLDIDLAVVFCDKTHFTYFNDFLDLGEVKQTESVKEKLQSMARLGLSLSSDKLIKSEMMRFLKFIPAGQRIVLNKVKLTGVWQQLAKVETRLLIIPKELAPEAEKNILLTIDDASLLLQALDVVLSKADSHKYHDEAQDLVEEIIALVALTDRERLLNKCSGLRLFKIHDLANKKDIFVAKSDLLGFRDQKTLFRYSSAPINSAERFGLGVALYQAVESCTIYFIKSDILELAFGKNSNFSKCDGKACLIYIHAKKPSLTSPKSRIKLLNQLSFSELSRIDKRTFRYLLHGDLDHYDNDSEFLLSVETDLKSVWEKLTRAIYKAGNDDWRLIDQVLVDDLSNKLSNQLDISKLDLVKILEALKYRFGKIDFLQLQLERDEYEVILQAIEDHELWKRLPFHEKLNGGWCAICEQCFLNNELVEIPSALEQRFVRIKKSKVEKIAEQQIKWIQPLNQCALIRIILSSSNPHDYWQLILEQIHNTPFDEDLSLLLKSKKWLLNTNRQPIKPEDIIDIEGLSDEVKRLTAECDAGYYAPDDISLNIRQHAAYGELKKLFACEKEGLNSLLLMIGDSEGHAIGPLTFNVDELLQFAELIADDLNMPGWALLANKKVRALLRQSDNSQENPLKPILNSLSAERYQAVLNALRESHENANTSGKSTIIKLSNAYLTLLASCSTSLELLKETKLLSREGHWVFAEQLCVDVEGVDDNYLLDREQARCLGTVIYSGNQQRSEKKHVVVSDEKLLLQSTPKTLRTYFKDWDGRVESELIGFFISLLGTQPEIEETALSFLRKRSVEGVRNKINWQIKQGDERDKVMFDGLSQQEAINKMECLIRVEDNDSITVSSIFNEPVKVKLQSKPKTIIINHSFASQYRVSFQLRQLNFSDWNESTLSTLLKNSAEFILKKVYEQSSSLEKVWADLGESDQLDIAVAGGLILDELPANLRQLSLQQNELHKFLQDYNNAKSLKKELEITHVAIESADEEIKKALQKMQYALTSDTETQKAVLHAIKSKISNHQYQNYSVPFELFQNADDAVFEYVEMQAFPEKTNLQGENELEAQQSHFHVLYDQETLLFLHWGRAINYFRGSEGFPGKERGFHRDLEKMLLMNTSDKQAENMVTGKFGLGFKSVYLISDRPKILSGRLGVEVFAAMLPEPLKEDDRSRLKSKIDQVSHTQLTATAIELPLSVGIDQADVLAKFRCYAGVLVVFSKAIKHILLNQDRPVSWQEKRIFEDLPEVRKGCISLVDQKVDAIKFVFIDDQQSYELLFAFGATGFKNFPNKVEQELLPKIWVLAPTHDEASIGFLINAGFDVDMGRMQLAHESPKNHQIVLHLGMHLAHILEQLNVMITDDWSTVRQSFDLANDVTPYKFWESLWSVLVSSWIRKDDNKIHQLVRTMLTKPNESFLKLLTDKSLLPNGLCDCYQQLIRLTSVKYVLKGVLCQDKFFRLAQDQLSVFLKAEELIHEQIQQDLFKLLPEEDKQSLRWLTFDLALFAEKSFSDRKANFEQASLWGVLLNQDILDELEKTEERKNEKLHLEKVLSSVEFFNHAQQFKQVSDLLDSQYGETEEKLRAAFAPDAHLLHSQYDENAARFFQFSRKQLKATLEQMEQWALAAPDLNKQKGVLNYLLKGERSDGLAEKLRTESKGTWLADLHEQSVHFNGWLKSEITQVLKRKLATDEAMERVNVGAEPDIDKPKPLNPEIVLNNVYNWWLQNKVVLSEKYSKHVYPEGVFPNLLDDSEELDRDGWMTLFFLGSLHTAGRTQDVQHRDAILQFKSKKWWDVFIQQNPQAAPEQWMHVLDEYLQDQFHGSQYESWMMRFVTIYRFACWLDDYSNSWLAIQQQSTRFSLEDVLNTATSHVHAGGGVSAPRLSRTLGIGANFILRELVRHKVLNSASAIVSSEHCFVPHLRVRKLFNKLGMQLEEEHADITQSQKIYDFIAIFLGKEKAIFDWDFDIPFQIIARDIELEQQLFSNNPIATGFIKHGQLDDAPAWAWDLFDNIPFFIQLVENNNLPDPIVGYELIDDDRRVLLQLELAWEKYHIGVAIGEGDEIWDEIQTAQKLGWQIFTVDELEDDLERFLECFLSSETI